VKTVKEGRPCEGAVEDFAVVLKEIPAAVGLSEHPPDSTPDKHRIVEGATAADLFEETRVLATLWAMERLGQVARTWRNDGQQRERRPVQRQADVWGMSSVLWGMHLAGSGGG
jgi:hypothetical protein